MGENPEVFFICLLSYVSHKNLCKFHFTFDSEIYVAMSIYDDLTHRGTRQKDKEYTRLRGGTFYQVGARNLTSFDHPVSIWLRNKWETLALVLGTGHDGENSFSTNN